MSRKLEDGNIVLGFATAQRGQQDTFDMLRKVWPDPNRATILKDMEDSYLEFMFSWIAAYAKDESGEWKRQAARVPEAFAADLDARGISYTKVQGTDKLSMKTLPGAYITACNVLDRAEKAGVDYTTLGKTAIEKELRVPKSPFQRAVEAANTLSHVWDGLTTDERSHILGKISPLED